MDSFFLSELNARLMYQYRPGNTPTILILHGLAGSGIEEYSPLFESKELFTSSLCTLDLLGFGHSDKPENFDYSLSSQLEILKTFLDMMSMSSLILIGHSMGGTLALLFAEKYPELVQGLVLAEGGLQASYLTLSQWAVRQKEEKFAKTFATLLSMPKTAEAGSLGGFTQSTTLSMTNAQAFYQSSRSLLEETKGDQLSNRFYQLSIPKEYWIGEYSLERWGNAYIKELSQAKVSYRVLAGAGHQLVLDSPQEFSSCTKDFLQSVTL